MVSRRKVAAEIRSNASLIVEATAAHEVDEPPSKKQVVKKIKTPRNLDAKKEPELKSHLMGENPMELLLATEYHSVDCPEISLDMLPSKQKKLKANVKPRTRERKEFIDDSSSENSDDFEEVSNELSETKPLTVKSVAKPSSLRHSLDNDIRRHVNLLWKRFQKNQSLALRKVYMLCFIGRGLHLSRICDYSYTRAFATSVIPHDLFPTSRKQKASSAKSCIEKVLKWYRQEFIVTNVQENKLESVLDLFVAKSISSKVRFIQGLVAVFRALNIPCRLLMHFSPKVINAEIYENGKLDLPKASKSSNQRNNRDQTKEATDKYLHMNIVPFGVKAVDRFDVWPEVFDCDKNMWLSIDPFSLNICEARDIEQMLNFSSRISKITFTAAYTIAFDQFEKFSDVTARYATKTLHTATRKERGPVEIENWWQSKILSKFKPSGRLAELETDDLARLASPTFHPVPSTKSELQGHPLYVVASGIHKYEALYPPDSKPISKINGESVFLRANVKEMHTEGKWLQEGRSIKIGEKPYKEVIGHKSRKQRKSDKPEDRPISGLYGEWQTEIFTPPPIIDDKIPRNKYGNYELFKPWMLPKECCYMRKQGIQTIARRLGIDYAPAMVGWDFHGGVNHPVIDGIIVCKKFANQLERVWRDDKETMEMTREVKKTELALMNWRRVIKALILGEKLRQRYL